MAVTQYPWLTEKDPPPGRKYRSYYVVGGFLAFVTSREHEDMLRLFNQLTPSTGPARVALSVLKAFPRLPDTPAPDAP